MHEDTRSLQGDIDAVVEDHLKVQRCLCVFLLIPFFVTRFNSNVRRGFRNVAQIYFCYASH